MQSAPTFVWARVTPEGCCSLLAFLAHRHDPRYGPLDAGVKGDAETNYSPDVAALDREDREEEDLREKKNEEQLHVKGNARSQWARENGPKRVKAMQAGPTCSAG